MIDDHRAISPSNLQYIGVTGISQDCVEAISLILSRAERIVRAHLLSADGHHAFLLFDEFDRCIAVKSGFTSGYTGEGPRALATALILLSKHSVEIDEIRVGGTLLESINSCSLSKRDCDRISKSKRVIPRRWQDYIYEQFGVGDVERNVANIHLTLMPWAIIDARLHDLALVFFDDSDKAILTGFRRLEDSLRARLDTVGVQSNRLFAIAFQGGDSELTWPGVDPGEHQGRANLFLGAYQAYRNPRAHGEIRTSDQEALAEFLLLNHLFRLEVRAQPRAKGGALQSK